ncbi:Expansin-B15 [Capsicum annuum]|uniref:expansin-B15-like n=1 Tax=Capsicum annuum TaxID=4072 RepID=UPI001FB0E0CC|nr:expansin-B15-like [Capsicum annuum]KAF3669094.1 Expansin-B15 [Capsicum annuum]
MSFNLPFIFTFLALCLFQYCTCAHVKSLNASLAGFQPAVATFYGSPTGAGSDGVACGYTNAVSQSPFNSFVSAGNGPLFRKGLGCGACYQVICNLAPCSGKPVTVTITDECPSCSGAVHFDLSGTAMGALAKPGQANALRNLGNVAISYQRVPCQYKTKIAFKVDPGSNPNFLSVNVEFENADGDLNLVEFLPSGSTQSITANHVFGATWSSNINPSTQPAPYSIRITTEFNKKLTATNVIPIGWKPGQTYVSNVNF